MRNLVTLLVAGDFAPKDRIRSIVDEGRYEQVFSEEVREVIEKADYSVVNLEAPVIKDGYKPIKKVGPTLYANNTSIKALRYAGFNLATLANNHMNDYGGDGVLNTIVQCKEEGLDTIGAGKNREAALKSLIKSFGDKRVAFINCCEHEFSITRPHEPGCNPIDIVEQSHAIKEAKSEADYVILIVHGGIEHYQLPTPKMQKTYRFFIEEGADVVINHHQHCYSGYEIYNSKPIFYGLGNFCFDWQKRDSKKWREGYMTRLMLGENIEVELIPYIQNDSKEGVRLMNDSDRHFFEENIERLNSIIVEPEKLEDEYEKFLCQTDKEMRSVLSLYPGRILTHCAVRDCFLCGLMGTATDECG